MAEQDPKLPEESKPSGTPVDPVAESLSKKIRHPPKTPGVYLFNNRRGTVPCIGKAKDLRNRFLR